jgi:dynein heavy chain
MVLFGLQVGERIDQAWEPILGKQYYKNKSQLRMIKFGDTEFEYNDKFRLYITTKVRRLLSFV